MSRPKPSAISSLSFFFFPFFSFFSLSFWPQEKALKEKLTKQSSTQKHP